MGAARPYIGQVTGQGEGALQQRALWIRVCVGPNGNPSYHDAPSAVLTRESNVLKQLIRNTPINNDTVDVRLDVTRESFRIFLMWANRGDGDVDVPIILKTHGNIVWRDLIDLVYLAETLEAWSFHNYILRALYWELRRNGDIGSTRQDTRFLGEKIPTNSMLSRLITDEFSGRGLANMQEYLIREEKASSVEMPPARGNRTSNNFTGTSGGRQNTTSLVADAQEESNWRANNKKPNTQTRGTQTGDTGNASKTKDKGKNNQNNQNSQNAQNDQRADNETSNVSRKTNQSTNIGAPNQQKSIAQQSNSQTPNFLTSNPELSNT